ncbi:rhomboid family intramembrane serine protease [Taibaiella sp. KBW10]|uniref:rhomboid family intramembrane serine protease n=1 Tax=Taibaiella sp. KBW10 TaxID=2153357 RepID=UPI000F599E5D|nr:rhomboid family intramembrane serine protease [Taibaiella sp. KBW10]RQO31452.1 rhomboid family intramembrane serine protease [Taibaiella sp. KBW10]
MARGILPFHKAGQCLDLRKFTIHVQKVFLSMPVTYIIIGISVLISLYCFKQEAIRQKLMLYPVAMRHPLQAYRLITSGFVHVDTAHLVFNMITLYFFGPLLERFIGADQFLMLYLSGIIVANLPSFYRHMHNPRFASLGASGGVASVIFACIYFIPWERICIFFFLCIPAILFAVGYLIYSAIMSRRAKQTINHTAHFLGSVYGLVYMIIIDSSHGALFLERLMNFHM